MNPIFNQKFLSVVVGVFLATRLFAADTNQPAMPAGVTREEMADNYLHIQEQIHESQLAIEKSQQAALEAVKTNAEAALQEAKSNADALAARLKSLEESNAESARKTQQTTLFFAGSFGLAGLGIMLLSVYFQWRAFTQLAHISSQQQAALTNGHAVHQLAAPGRAVVESANAQLLDVVDRLEKRIHELESGQKMLPEIVVPASTSKPSDLLTEGQKYLDANAPLKALECFDQFLSAHPERADGLVKRAAALEKLGREDEALMCYNHAIAADSSLVIAHLHKGGLLNRLRRYDEALNCYEQALLAQEKKNGRAVN